MYKRQDIDYFVTLPDGSTALLELKTTNYNARGKWSVSYTHLDVYKRQLVTPGEVSPDNLHVNLCKESADA